jgi:hypothetical protein
MSRNYVAHDPTVYQHRARPVSAAEMESRRADLLRRGIWRYCGSCQRFRPCWLIVRHGLPHGGLCASCSRVWRARERRIEDRLLALAAERMAVTPSPPPNTRPKTPSCG